MKEVTGLEGNINSCPKLENKFYLIAQAIPTYCMSTF